MNANYLDKSRTVVQPPGGYSNFSIGWQVSSSPPPRAPPKTNNKAHHAPISFSYKSEPSQLSPVHLNNSSFVSQCSHPQSDLLSPLHQAQGYLTLQQSNRLLQRQLEYYQRKNKMLRENIFGGKEYIQHQRPLGFSNYRPRQEEELQMALRQREQGRKKEDYTFKDYQQSRSRVEGEQRTSVKVNNPPGGRSSIVFG